MKKRFTILLMLALPLLYACSSISEQKNQEPANEKTKAVKYKKKKQQQDSDPWSDYGSYTVYSSFLDNMGLASKSQCVLALMKTIPSPRTVEQMEATKLIRDERNKIFKAFIDEGVKLLKGTGIYLEFTDKEIREFVYQNLQQNEIYLRNVFLLAKQIRNKDKEVKKDVAYFDQKNDFQQFYINADCKTLLNYELTL